MHLTPEEKDECKDLAQKKLLNIRFHPKYPNVACLKYSRRAFWSNAWDEHPILLRTRGLVVDWFSGRIIAEPFTKVFNYGEKEFTKTMFRDDELVVAVEKVNGFLAVATYDPIIGDFFFSTSGTFDSEYADLARKWIDNPEIHYALMRNSKLTFMFEICDPSDPHIVPEQIGAHFIGAKGKETGKQLGESHLDVIHLECSMTTHRPDWKFMTFADVKKSASTTHKEGFMVYDVPQKKGLKIKSPYYLSHKFLSRSKKKLEPLWTSPEQFQIDDDFVWLAQKIKDEFPTFEDWVALDEQQRLGVIRSYYQD